MQWVKKLLSDMHSCHYDFVGTIDISKILEAKWENCVYAARDNIPEFNAYFNKIDINVNYYCWPKNSGMYPMANTLTPVVNDYTYIKNANPSTPPIGVPSTTNNTDSITYNNYTNGGALSNEYGLANATSVQQQQLAQLQTQMNLLSNQISGLTTEFGDGSQTAATQMTANVQGVGEYLTDLTQTNKKIKNYNTSIDNILQDSDITVLQKNYDYLFWSILAAGSVLVAMNIVKK
jgi:hypothetical protein